MVNTIKRRGLSDVVTTVLIILLVLAAVAIIWGYLRGALQQGGQQISSACITLDLKPVSCNVSSNVVGNNGSTVRYGRNSGAATLTNVTLVFTYPDGTTSTNTSVAPNVLETKVFNTLFAPGVPKPVSVSVAGTVTTEGGAVKLCDRTEAIQCTV